MGSVRDLALSILFLISLLLPLVSVAKCLDERVVRLSAFVTKPLGSDISHFTIPSDSAGAANALLVQTKDCSEGDPACGSVRDVAIALARASMDAPGCSDAANSFATFYESANPPKEVAMNYDLSCLNSFEKLWEAYTGGTESGGGAIGGSSLAALR